jgi:hypothetical protein
MELDEKTLQGHWADDYKSGAQIFIINDAIFSKLCILGEDVEPCFEGSSVTAPEVSSSFELQADEFTSTLFTTMKRLQELTFSLKKQGGSSMVVNEEVQAPENTAPVTENTLEGATEENTMAPAEDFSAQQDNSEQQVSPENQCNVEFKKDEDKKKDITKNELVSKEEYTVLEQKYNELNEKYTSLEQQNQELVEFKKAVEDKEKDALIAQFYMLSDEDKKEVIENKSKYSLDDIEAKLSVICVRKKVNFENKDDSEAEQNPATTFNLNSAEVCDLPAWLKAVDDHANRNN